MPTPRTLNGVGPAALMDTPAARRLRPWLTTADGLVSVTANVWRVTRRAGKAGRQFG
jgi:hypothetical protein